MKTVQLKLFGTLVVLDT